MSKDQRASDASADMPGGPFVVAEGRSTTSKRGILGPGTEVSPNDFMEGEKSLRVLYNCGCVTEKPPVKGGRK
jgi:hypothetical protein